MTRLLSAAFALACSLAPAAAAEPNLYVGAAENLAKSSDTATATSQLQLAASAGFGVVRVVAVWTPGATAPGGDDLLALQTTARTASLAGIRLVVAVVPAQATLDQGSRTQFAGYAAALARALPTVRDFVVGDEPNSPAAWSPQFAGNGQPGAGAAYERLLAATYDALKAVDAGITVLGGALAPRGNDDPKAGAAGSQSPGKFLLNVGAAYRSSGRSQPIMDALAYHPFGDDSSQPPSFVHGARSTTITLADYPQLVSFLRRAFANTGQAGATLPIVYDDYGVQTAAPPAKASLYTNPAAPGAADAVTEAAQGAAYAQALKMAYCQPTVAGFLFRHVVDESDLAGWQTGLFYPDLQPKSDLAVVRGAVLAARRGSLVTCPGLTTAVDVTVLEFTGSSGALPADNSAWSIRVGCVRDCVYVAYLERLPAETPVLAARGTVAGGSVRIAMLPSRTVRPGSYRLTIRLSSRYNPGPQLVRSSAPFTVG